MGKEEGICEEKYYIGIVLYSQMFTKLKQRTNVVVGGVALDCFVFVSIKLCLLRKV